MPCLVFFNCHDCEALANNDGSIQNARLACGSWLWQLRQQSNHQIASAKAMKVTISEKRLTTGKG